jgi:hypothetical protein
MKKIQYSRFTTIILIAVFAISLSNCAVRVGTNRSYYKTKRIPPGQAKKMNGDRSAKRYAPGQNK